MSDKEKHIKCAAQAVENFKECLETSDAHAIADLICDLGHLADGLGVDFVKEVERGVAHWRVERNAKSGSGTV